MALPVDIGFVLRAARSSAPRRGARHRLSERPRAAAQLSASTQNQALAAKLFPYREVIGVNLPWLASLVRAPIGCTGGDVTSHTKTADKGDDSHRLRRCSLVVHSRAAAAQVVQEIE
jgi:hypothetical protein